MTKPTSCDATAHDFDKFDDATIYCRRCGEQRVMDVQRLIAQLPPITYLPCPGPHYPYTPYVWGPTWAGTGTGDWVPPSGTSITYLTTNASGGVYP